MALPASGGTYEDLLQPGLNEVAVRKAIVTDILIRDYNGSMTDLSDPSVGLTADGVFSPFAEDGELRDDLLITADGANLGFYHIGLLTEDGSTYTPSVSREPTRAAQSRRPVRVDITEEDDQIRFSALESTPLIDWLNDDKPLTGLPDLGKIGYSSVKPAYGRNIERQIIALLFDGNEYAAKVFPRMGRSDVGETAWNKATPDSSALTYQALVCPYAGYPVVTLREGQGWRAKGGYPNFGLVAPVATATTAGAATVAHAVPTGIGDPWTYTVEDAASSSGPWTTTTVDSAAVAGGTITHTVSGVTTGARVFRVTAEGSNGLSATSAVSNEVTIT